MLSNKQQNYFAVDQNEAFNRLEKNRDHKWNQQIH